MTETTILKQTMIEASKLGLVCFRNNVGMLPDKNGRMVQYGLCKGSSDIIGFDRKEGFFVAIECKTDTGRVRKEQQIFLDTVKKSGGFSCIIRDAKNLKIILDEYRASRYSNKTTETKGD